MRTPVFSREIWPSLSAYPRFSRETWSGDGWPAWAPFPPWEIKKASLETSARETQNNSKNMRKNDANSPNSLVAVGVLVYAGLTLRLMLGLMLGFLFGITVGLTYTGTYVWTNDWTYA